MYRVFGGRSEYKRTPEDEVQRKILVWLGDRQSQQTMQKREEAKIQTIRKQMEK